MPTGKDVATAIGQDDVRAVPWWRYAGQRIFVVRRDTYVYLVPFVEDDRLVVLKTIIPSRKATRMYLRQEP